MARHSNWGAKEGANPHAGIYTGKPKEVVRIDKDPLSREDRQRIEMVKWKLNNPNFTDDITEVWDER